LESRGVFKPLTTGYKVQDARSKIQDK